MGNNLSATIFINRPAAEVFDYVLDVPHDVEWRTGVLEAAFTSEGATGVGTTGIERFKLIGQEMEATWTIFEYKPGRLARWTLDSGPIQGRGGYVCEQCGAGMNFTLEAYVKPSGVYRLLGPIFGMLGRRQNLDDVVKLKALLEAKV